MNDDLRVVYQSPVRAECADRALVLAAVRIPHQVIADAASCALLVPAEYSAQAMQELTEYDQENPPRARPQRPVAEYYDALPGLIAYVLVLCAVAVIADQSPWSKDWYTAGRIDGALIRAGEWWRTVTALTLHADLEHLAGNLVFGVLFGLFAGRLLGPGVAWLSILVAGAAGNGLNMLLLESVHRAIGASTAVFAALGLVAGFVWRSKLMAQDRWPYRLGPVVGGFALLMYTGTGGENTDIGAHLMGFLSGFGGGLLLSRWRDRLSAPRVQAACGGLAITLLLSAWATAIM